MDVFLSFSVLGAMQDTYLGVVSMETDPKSMGLNETTKEMSEDREELIPKALQIGKTRNGKG